MDKMLKLSKVPMFVLQPVLQTIPFFRKVLSRDPDQIRYIVENSVLQEIQPGETVIKKGELDNSIYFLVMGFLAVYPDNDSVMPVAKINPDEMFGEMAMIQRLERTTTVRGDLNSRRIVLIRTDFSPFGELNDMRRISLATKMVFYQAIVETIRHRLDRFCEMYPEFAVDHDIALPPLPQNASDAKEMLVYHYRTGQRLAQVLARWNDQLGDLFGRRGSPHDMGLNTLLTMLDQETERQSRLRLAMHMRKSAVATGLAAKHA
ncbi:MAG: cyclic nucleotide-binding domain-containing protein [Deltaproteobacteria bacterium]|nr:cyclic nucleotide-binding domain-containing protein [Deltaproteobacteria bacterium]